MGVAAAGETPQGHHAGLSRGLRAQHHGEEARRLRALQPRPEGEDEEDRLLAAG